MPEVADPIEAARARIRIQAARERIQDDLPASSDEKFSLYNQARRSIHGMPEESPEKYDAARAPLNPADKAAWTTNREKYVEHDLRSTLDPSYNGGGGEPITKGSAKRLSRYLTRAEYVREAGVGGEEAENVLASDSRTESSKQTLDYIRAKRTERVTDRPLRTAIGVGLSDLLSGASAHLIDPAKWAGLSAEERAKVMEKAGPVGRAALKAMPMVGAAIAISRGARVVGPDAAMAAYGGATAEPGHRLEGAASMYGFGKFMGPATGALEGVAAKVPFVRDGGKVVQGLTGRTAAAGGAVGADLLMNGKNADVVGNAAFGFVTGSGRGIRERAGAKGVEVEAPPEIRPEPRDVESGGDLQARAKAAGDAAFKDTAEGFRRPDGSMEPGTKQEAQRARKDAEDRVYADDYFGGGAPKPAADPKATERAALVRELQDSMEGAETPREREILDRIYEIDNGGPRIGTAKPATAAPEIRPEPTSVEAVAAPPAPPEIRPEPVEVPAPRPRSVESIEREATGKSLSQFVRGEGGINEGSAGLTGEVNSLARKGSGSSGLVRRDGGGKSVEQMMQSAKESGYDIPEGQTPAQFLERVYDDATFGERSFSPETTDLAALSEVDLRRQGMGEADRVSNAPPEQIAAAKAYDALEVEPISPTSVKERVTNRERLARGLGEMEQPLRQKWGEVADKAFDALDANPNRPYELVAELRTNPRPHTATEAALLDIHRVDLHKARRQADLEGLAAASRGDLDAVAEAKARATAANDQFLELEQATKTSGTETARALAFRRAEMAQDYSLVAMETRRRAENDYAPLTPKQAAETKALHDALAKAVADRDAYAARLADIEAKRNVGEVVRPRSRTASSSAEYGKKNTVVTREAYEATKAAVREKMGRLSAGVDPTLLVDLAKIGAYHLEAGARGFASWAKAMTDDLGDKVTPHLRAVWSAAHTQLAEKTIGEVSKKVREGGKPIDQMPAEIGKLAEMFVRHGVTDRTKLVEAVHEVLSSADPRITKRDTMDAISGYGKMRALDADPVKAELRELKGQMQQVAKLEDMASGKAPLKSGIERQAPGDAQRELIRKVNEAKRAGGYDVPDPATQLRTALDAVKTRLKNEIADLDRQIAAGVKDVPNRTRLQYDAEAATLKARRDQVKKEYDAAFGKTGLTDQQRVDIALKALKTRLKNRAADLERRVATGDLELPKRRPVERDAEAIRLEANMETAKKAWNEALMRDKLANRTLVQKAATAVLAEAPNTARALMTSFDFSAVLRQGAFVALGHPVRAARAMGAMFKAFVSKGGQARAEAELTLRPTYGLAKRSGLFLAEHGATSLSKMEEAYMSRWAEKVPGVAASQRAYTTFLNRLRMDSFDAMVAHLSRDATPTPKEAAAIASYVNTATGRGGGKNSAGLAALSTAFFSPRLVASRFQLLAGQPMYRGTARTRRLVAQEYGRFLAGIGFVYALGKAAGGEVEKDPRSSDFGKLRFGDTRLDPLAGLSQVTVLGARLATGQTKSVAGNVRDIRGEGVRYGQGDSADVLARFLRTKLAPAVGAGVDLVSGKDVIGRKVTLGGEVAGLLTPMVIGDIYGAMRANGVPKGTALGLLSMFGMSIQNHDDKKHN